MVSLRKVLALLLCLAIACGCLASCDLLNGSGSSGNKNADEYYAKVRIVFASNDKEIISVVDTLNSSSEIFVSGDSVKVLTRAKTNAISVENCYVKVDRMLYHRLTVGYSSYEVSDLKCASLDETEQFLFLSAVGPGADIGIDDFEKVTEVNPSNTKTSYNCTNIKSDAKASLETVLQQKMALIGATVVLKDVVYLLNIDDGLNTLATLSCDLQITLEGKTYEITMRTYTEYDYDYEIETITAPENEVDYRLVSYDEIMK